VGIQRARVLGSGSRKAPSRLPVACQPGFEIAQTSRSIKGSPIKRAGATAGNMQRLGAAPVRRNGRERPESRAPEHSLLPAHARGARRNRSEEFCCRIRSLRLRCARPHSILAAPYTLSLQFDTSNDIDLPCAVFCPIVGSNTHAHVVVVVVVVGGGGGGGGGNGGDAATTLDKLGAPVVH